MRAFWHLFTLTGHADLLKCQLSVSCGSGEVCHSSRGSPYSRGCTLNSKPMWSISRPRPQRLIWLMVDFCSHSDAHHLSVLDSEHMCFQKDILERYVCFPLERTPSKIVLSLMASQTCSCYKIHSGIIPLNLYVSHFLLEQDGFHLLGGKTTQWGLSSGCSHTCQSCQLHPVQPLWTPVRNTRSLHRGGANTTLIKSLFISCLFHVVNCVTPLL